MSDDIWRRDEIASPCVNLCVIHPASGLCAGCYRTVEEIGLWSTYTPQERADLMADLPAREIQVRPRRKGRAARLKNGP